MRAFVAMLATAALIALVVLPAHGQGRKRHSSDQDQKTSQKKSKTDDKDYNRALSSLPDQKFDPWGGVR